MAELLAAKNIIICGHYGVGKTNFALNLAYISAGRGEHAALIDLDLVNPYFRSSDYTDSLTKRGVDVIPPVFAGTTLDVPSVSSRMISALNGPHSRVIIDAGGDDAGATVLGSIAEHLAGADMFYCVNLFRPQVCSPEDALAILREIEAASHLKATGIVDNSHLSAYTSAEDILRGYQYAKTVAGLAGLPLAAVTVPRGLFDTDHETMKHIENLMPVDILVKTPWQQ